MKRLFVIPLLVMILVLSACGGKDETPAPAGKTGLKGQVFLAECSGDQIATDCFSQEPYQATLVVYQMSSGSKMEEVARILTEKDGTFEHETDPGVYYIHPDSPSMYPIATDYQVVVVEGEMTEMEILYDSGAR